MTTQALFYRQVEPVSSERHADLCVDTQVGHAFAARVNFVPLTVSEFQAGSHHYPIVFLAQGDLYVPVALLGYGHEQNLFLTTEGGWDCEYVPAYVRRYPFIMANLTEQQTFTLCIDRAAEACNEAGRGERLFLIGGGRSAYLERMLTFVQQYQADFDASTRFAARLHSWDLLEQMQAQVALGSGEKLSLGGFLTVSRDRLRALSGEQLRALAADDSLELVYRHLFSLDGFGPLLDRHAARRQTADGGHPQDRPADV